MATNNPRSKALEARRYTRHVEKLLHELREVHPEYAHSIEEALRRVVTLLEWLDEVVELFDPPKEDEDARADEG